MFLDKFTDIRIKSKGISAGIGYRMNFQGGFILSFYFDQTDAWDSRCSCFFENLNRLKTKD